MAATTPFASSTETARPAQRTTCLETPSPGQMTFAARMRHLHTSEIRELLKLTEQPDVISFAGGLPDPALFPGEALGEILRELAAQEGAATLQYGTTAGYGPLREAIAARLRHTAGLHVDKSQVMITNGSQQGLDLAGMLFVDPGAPILCESPTYLAAINAFRAYEPRFIPVPTDDEGMLPDALAHILAREPDIRMAYVIPDFQNPTGKTWSRQRREQFMDLISRTRIPVIEDNPYGELRFEGPSQPSLMTMDPNSQVIGLGTFSKILCPGLRIGWITASPALLAQFDLLKQGTDLHTAQITQACVARYLERHDLQAHIQTIRETYRRRRDVMLEAIGTHLGDRVSVNRPEGGLFLWMRLPEGMDARQLLTACLKQKVAFVPGESFHPQGGHQNTIRLNFSNASETDIREGISRISSALDAFHRPAAWV